MTAAAHRPATLEDVARVAGVSRSTASRVIAGTGFASPAARELVTAAVDQLGYVPNPAARALVRGGGGGVRLVVAVLGTSAAVLDDPYVAPGGRRGRPGLHARRRRGGAALAAARRPAQPRPSSPGIAACAG